ncbi:MAG: exosortase family protein XrtF [Flavobacteriales bacterium]|nr:exosortase family protein XrtF [Flavobacteriales bacterium]
MIKELLVNLKQNKKAILFVVSMLGIYLILQAIYDYGVSPNTSVDSNLIDLIISQAEGILQLMGYELLTPDPAYGSHMGIKNTSGVVIGNPCDGLSLFILFTSFLIIFSGKWWFKLIYIILGIGLIHLLNVFRVVSLALIVEYSPESLDFHHSYTFTLFIYSIIFMFWMLRIKIYQRKKI